MFNVNPSQFEDGLIEPRIHIGKDLVATPLSPQQAKSGRDALAKAIYHRLFLWIVKKINSILSHEQCASFIGVLDITGFEICKTNSFEQFLVTFANEKLQQFFNHHMFTLEQEEYKREKIDWIFIDERVNFGLDSQITIDLIESKNPPGIMAVLNEQSMSPGTTSLTLSAKLNAQFGKHPKYDDHKSLNFGILHYAGAVSYEVSEWLERNKETLQPDLEDVMRESKDPFIRRLFTENFEDLPTSFTLEQTSGTKGTAFVTVSAQYKYQLTNLMGALQATNPHFVRCILPNRRQEANLFDDTCVLDQLRCNGVLEGLRISRLGFPDRCIFANFVQRYQMVVYLAPSDLQDPRLATTKILKQLSIPESEYKFGLTKVFFRTGHLPFIEELHQKKVGEISTTFQAAARGWIERKRFTKGREKHISARIIQDNMRAYLEFKNWPWWKLFSKTRPMIRYRSIEPQLLLKEGQVKRLTAQLEAEIAEHAALENQLQCTEDKIIQLSEALKDEKQKGMNLQDEIYDLKNINQIAESKVAGLERKLAKQRNRLESLSHGRKEAELKVQELTTLLADEKEIRTNLHKKKEDVATEQCESNNVRGSYPEKLKNDLQVEVDERKQIPEHCYESDLRAAKIQLEDEKKGREVVDRKRAHLEAELREMREDLHEAVNARKVITARKAKLQSDYDELKESAESDTAARIAFQQQAIALEAKVAALQQVAQGAEASAEKANRRRRNLEFDLQDAQTKLNAETKLRLQLQKHLRKAEDELRHSRLRADEANITASRQYIHAQSVSDENDDLRRQLEVADSNAIGMARARKQSALQISDLKSHLDDAVAAFVRTEKAKRNLAATVEEMEALLILSSNKSDSNHMLKKQQEIDAVKKELAQEEGRKAKDKEVQQILRNEISTMEEKVAVLLLEKDDLERALKKLEGEVADEQLLKKAEQSLNAILSIRADGIPLTATIEEARKMREEPAIIRADLDADNAEKRERSLRLENDELWSQLKREVAANDKLNRAKRILEVEFQEMKDQIDEYGTQILEMEEAKRLKDAELGELKAKFEADRAKSLEEKTQLTKNLESFKVDIEELQREKTECTRMRRRLEAENDDLNVMLDKEIKERQKHRRWHLRFMNDRMEPWENQCIREDDYPHVVAALRAELENAITEKTALARNYKLLELQLVDARTQMEIAVLQHANAEKPRRYAENQLKGLREQVDALKETANDLAASKARLEVELGEIRQSFIREAETREAAETARARMQRQLAEVREQLDEEIILRSNAERLRKKYEAENTGRN